MQPAEAFLSHSSRDRRFADRLVRVFARHSVPFFYSKRSIIGAQEWHDEIGDALGRCDWFVLVLSPDAVKSEWVKRELLYALTSERYKGRIVPLLYRACDFEKLSWTLSNIQRVDFRRHFREGSRQLLKIWGLGLKTDRKEGDTATATKKERQEASIGR